MVQYNRLTSDSAIVDYLKKLEQKIDGQATKGSGDIIITDPDTGVETIIGTLPDGTTGLQEFVGDTEPPPVTTTPIVSAQPGNFVVSWDGLFLGGMTAPRDFVHVNVIGYKISGGSTVLTVPVGVIRTASESVFVSTDIALGGEYWQFALASEDYSGNVATESARSTSLMMIDAISVVSSAWTDLNADVTDAATAASNAQSAAAQAAADADAANTAALNAAGIANSKGKVLTQSTTPAVADQNSSTLWIDTTSGANTPKNWNGSAWVAVTDKTATDAASLAATKGKVLVQNTAPTGVDANAQTLWIDTTGGANTPKKWVSGTTWTAVTDKVATDAAALAATKGKVLTQSTTPAVADQNSSTLWIDTTGGANTPKRWSGSAWVAVTDKIATDAAAAVIVAQTRADQAFNTATTAATNAGTAQTTADGKNKMWVQGTAPAGTAHKINDIWFDSSNDNRVSRWDGSTWALSLLGDAAIQANINAAKITVGELAAARIKAKSLGVDKLMITSTDNFLMEGDFSNNGTSWQLSANKFISPTAGRSSLPAFRFTGLAGTITSLNLNNKISISSDARFRGSLWVKSSVAAPAGTIKLVGRFYYSSTLYNDIVLATNIPLLAETWSLVDGIVPPTIPANTIAAEFYISVTTALSTDIVDIDFAAVMRAADGKLLVDGSVTATKLIADLALVSDVIAGNPLAQHARMTPRGFEVYAPVDGGAPAIVARMGSTDGSGDLIQITGTDGIQKAGINPEGRVSGQYMDVEYDVLIDGDSVLNKFSALPKGVIAWRQFTGVTWPTLGSAGGEVGLFEIGWATPETNARMYAVNVPINLLKSLSGSAGTHGLIMRITTDGSAPSIPGNSQIIGRSYAYATAGGFCVAGFNNILISSNNGPYIRIMVSLFGTVASSIDTTSPLMQISVEDMGEQVPTAGSVTTGGVTPTSGGGTVTPPPDPVVTKTVTYSHNSVRSFTGGNGIYAFDTTKGYQGLSPAGYGNLKSLWTFPSVTSLLSGATVNKIEAYFYFEHWYNGSGGTARIVAHGNSGQPTTYSSLILAISSPNWPRAAGRWVTIPSSLYAGFKSGTYKGFGLEGDGTYNTYGIANSAKIRITYTK